MAEGKKDDRVLKMLKTGIIGEDWPKAAYLIVIIKDEDGGVIFKGYYDSSDHKGHAEIKMLEDEKFKRRIKDTNPSVSSGSSDSSNSGDSGPVDILMTINYSPCWECAPKLIKFYNDNKSSIKSFKIRFAHPFNTKKKEEQASNEKCLWDLVHKAGFTLEAMNEETWFDLVMKEKFGLDPDKLRERDKTTIRELKGLLREKTASGGPEASALKTTTIQDMTEKALFDLVMEKVFNLDPKKVRARDEKTRKKLEELLREETSSDEETSSEDEGLANMLRKTGIR